jgi:hypothetical protein
VPDKLAAGDDTTALQEPPLSKADLRARVDFETARRTRLAVPCTAGGVLYLLGAITVSSVLKGLPTVGVLQGVAPALAGQANPAVSPRAAEVRFYDHHVFGLIGGALLSSLAVGALVFVLLFLFDSARFRRSQTASIIRPLVLVGGTALAVLTVLAEIVQALAAHSFVTGHDFTTSAVEHVFTKNVLYEILGFATPLAALAFVAGMISLMVSTVRVGLQPRWLGILGGVGAVILLIPSQELSLITAFWMVATGILLMGRFPGGDPPAWPAGAARPWPSQVQARASRDAQRGGGSGGGRRGRGKEAAVPEPVQPAANSGSRRSRKRKK